MMTSFPCKSAHDLPCTCVLSFCSAIQLDENAGANAPHSRPALPVQLARALRASRVESAEVRCPENTRAFHRLTEMTDAQLTAFTPTLRGHAQVWKAAEVARERALDPATGEVDLARFAALLTKRGHRVWLRCSAQRGPAFGTKRLYTFCILEKPGAASRTHSWLCQTTQLLVHSGLIGVADAHCRWPAAHCRPTLF